MENTLLLNHVETVLGKSKSTSRGNHAFHCPFCHHSKPKLEINFTPNKHQHNQWHCWVCDTKGKTIYTLFKKAKVNPKYITALKPLIPKVYNAVDEVKDQSTTILELPKEYKSLRNVSQADIKARKALYYLKQRGISKADILKYNIGYGDGGIYDNHIIIPSYDKDFQLNYFLGRNLDPEAYQKYKNPPTDRNVVMFESFINWDLPITLCEGVFDAIAIKRNAIPILGKNISPILLGKLLNHSKEIYIALDKDASQQAFKYAKKFIDEGKQVYFVDLPDKDPSDMGFEKYTNHVQDLYSLTFADLLERKLSLI